MCELKKGGKRTKAESRVPLYLFKKGSVLNPPKPKCVLSCKTGKKLIKLKKRKKLKKKMYEREKNICSHG